VIVMTSNLGSSRIQDLANSGADYEVMKSSVMEVVGQHFRPEFINRVDEIVVFHPLDAAEIRQIAAIQLKQLSGRLQSHGYGLDVSDAALSLLGESGFDPVYGARPLKRAIQQQIENPLAQKILAGEFDQGDTIKVDVDGERFSFSSF